VSGPRYVIVRTPLAAALSADDGATFSEPLILEDGAEKGCYAYTAIHPVEDGVLLAYCAGHGEDEHSLARLRIRKIRLSELDK
jgi:hypothetical protein